MADAVVGHLERVPPVREAEGGEERLGILDGENRGRGCAITARASSPSRRSSSISTGPTPVWSTMRPRATDRPTTQAVPTSGCPAKGSSRRGVKMRTRASPSSARRPAG